MDAPASMITLGSVLCTSLPTHASNVHKKNPGRRRMGEPKPTRASMVMVAPPQIPRNAKDRAKGKANRAAKDSIKAGAR